MYLSRVSLDLEKRETMMAMANPQRFHGAVEQAFPGERRRRLWRLDPLGGRLYLLILSEDWPALSGIEEQFGCGEPGGDQGLHPFAGTYRHRHCVAFSPHGKSHGQQTCRAGPFRTGEGCRPTSPQSSRKSG